MISCSPHERSDMRGTTAMFVAPDFATLIRVTIAIFVARMSEATCGERYYTQEKRHAQNLRARDPDFMS
jgi:hypothetical protein